jgi:hypothetical protein
MSWLAVFRLEFAETFIDYSNDTSFLLSIFKGVVAPEVRELLSCFALLFAILNSFF